MAVHDSYDQSGAIATRELFASPDGATLSACGRRVIPTKAILAHKGDPVQRFWVIRSGMVKRLIYLSDGRVRVVRLQSRGEWIGLEGLVGRAFTHTVVAVEKVEVEQYSVPSVDGLAQSNPSALTYFLEQWHNDIIKADKWITEFSTGNVKQRVARLIEYLATVGCGPAGRTVELLTVSEMAEVLGVTQESVSRVVAEFKRSLILQLNLEASGDEYKLDSHMLARELNGRRCAQDAL